MIVCHFLCDASADHFSFFCFLVGFVLFCISREGSRTRAIPKVELFVVTVKY